MHRLILLDNSLQDEARQLAELYNFELSKKLPADNQFYLCLDFNGLSLKQGDNPKVSVNVDFTGGSNAHRLKFGGGQGQDIAKVIGVSAYKPSVVDATAGLGRDSFVLASLGCQVEAHERHPVVAALLADGLNRARHHELVGEIVRRIELKFGSSHELLRPIDNPEQQPDVVYLDPMFEHDEKQTAQVKKDMQAFRTLVGQDTDANELLALALAHARCRVVVKRARKAAPLANQTPSFAIIGKANRFDVYAKAKVQPL
ncbi:MAG: class I SAM-dependent methyltransferase [Venatoribacter sp.]